MNRYIVAAAAGLLVSACSSDGTNPFTQNQAASGGGTDTGTDTGTDVDGDRTLPPGTASPSPAVALFRSEPTSDTTTGNGTVSAVSYNAANDTFTVDGLGFDGNNVYGRGTAVGSLGPYAVYEAANQFTDPGTGSVINQFTHRAIYGISPSRNTQFAIVRTGAYVGYGFGGFVYQRNNGVTLPTSGQALYQGVMAGMRDFDGAGGLEYTTGDVQIAIDFDDFNDATGQRGDAVRGQITNRMIYDINGNDITEAVLTRIEDDANITLNAVPVATFTVGPGVLDDNGEILGSVQSYYTDSDGTTQVFEEGNYYAIVSGANAEEVVGIVVLENTLDPVATSVRETSGFILYR